MLNDKTRPIYDFFLDQGFKPITTDDYALFKKYEGETRLVELTATLTINWAFASNGSYKIIMDYLCSVWFFEGGTYFCIQAGEETKDSLKELITVLYDLCIKSGLSDLKINFIDEALLEDYRQISGYQINVEYDNDLSEYAYKPQDILELNGADNFYKRKRLKKFISNSDIKIEPLSKQNFKVCFEVEEEWCKGRDCECCKEISVGCVKESLEIMKTIYNESIYNGVIGFFGGKPVAYAIWEIKKNGVLFVFFSKAVVPDLNVYLYYIMAKEYSENVTYINNGADTGLPGLRQFKSHLSIHELWKNYLCIFKKD